MDLNLSSAALSPWIPIWMILSCQLPIDSLYLRICGIPTDPQNFVWVVAHVDVSLYLVS